MDYESLSDFEVNKAVAEALGLDHKPHEDHQTTYLYVDERTGEGRSFCPCNHVSDAWPVIVENKINIHTGEFPVAFLMENYWTYRIEHMDENPLRAAMIVFLKMVEAKDAES